MAVSAYIDDGLDQFVVGNKRLNVTRKDWVKLGRVGSVEDHLVTKLGGKRPYVDDNMEENPNNVFFTVDGKLIAVYDRETSKTLSVFDAPTLDYVNKPNEHKASTVAGKLIEKLTSNESIQLDKKSKRLILSPGRSISYGGFGTKAFANREYWYLHHPGSGGAISLASNDYAEFVALWKKRVSSNGDGIPTEDELDSLRKLGKS